MSSESSKDSIRNSVDAIADRLGTGEREVDNRLIEVQLNSGEVKSVNNFDGDKMNQWRLKSIACGPECLPFDKMPAEGIALKYFYCHKVEMIRPNSGEIIEPIRTAMLTVDGKAYSFVSDFIAREIDSLIELWGRGPWPEGLKIKVVKFQTRKGMACYQIQPMM